MEQRVDSLCTLSWALSSVERSTALTGRQTDMRSFDHDIFHRTHIIYIVNLFHNVGWTTRSVAAVKKASARKSDETRQRRLPAECDENENWRWLGTRLLQMQCEVATVNTARRWARKSTTSLQHRERKLATFANGRDCRMPAVLYVQFGGSENYRHFAPFSVVH